MLPGVALFGGPVLLGIVEEAIRSRATLSGVYVSRVFAAVGYAWRIDLSHAHLHRGWTSVFLHMPKLDLKIERHDVAGDV